VIVVAALAVCGAVSAEPTRAPVPTIARSLDRIAASGRFTGTVLVAKDGHPVLERAYGLADARKHRRNTIGTAFGLASLGKTFTGVAVAQLVQRGAVAFDDPVGRYVRGLPAPVAAVTVAQLLSHTSGLGDFFGDPGYARLQPKLTTLAAYVPLIAHERLRFTPGSRFGYSNSGYLLLGLVIERASHMSYYDYLRRNIFRPAGMRTAGCYWRAHLPPVAAVGYLVPGVPNTDSLPPRGTSAGGCYASAKDLLAFADALLGHRLLNARLTSIVTSPKVRAPGGGYGYGFGIRNGRPGDPPTVWHNGGAPGVGSELDINARLGYTVVILANDGPDAVPPVADLVLNALRVP
jgi:D-alanyl-D-alanine carboxypeptidase